MARGRAQPDRPGDRADADRQRRAGGSPGFEDFDNDPDELEDVSCEALPAPKKDTVATCSVTAVGIDSTVVLFFTDDDGSFLATLY